MSARNSRRSLTNGALPLELKMRVEEEDEDDPDYPDPFASKRSSDDSDDLEDDEDDEDDDDDDDIRAGGGGDEEEDDDDEEEEEDMPDPMPVAVTITPLEGDVQIKQEEGYDSSTGLEQATVHEEVDIKEEDGNREEDVLEPPLAIHIKEEVREEDEEDMSEPVSDDDSNENEGKSATQFDAVPVEEGENSEEEILPHAAMVVVPGGGDEGRIIGENVKVKPTAKSAKRAKISSKRVNTVYRCSHCQVCYTTEEYLKNHIQRGCRSRVSLSGVDTVYRCPNCSLCYTSPQYLAGHVRRGCRYRPTPIKNAYLCIVCGEGFNNYGDLYQHKRAKHDIKSLPTTSSNSSPQAELSEQTESKNPTNRCPSCPRTFATAGHLAHHMRSHAGTNPNVLRTLKCPNCPRFFSTPGYLRKHLQSHMRTGSDHSCDVCGEDFGEKSYADKEQHYVTHHPSVELHRCIQCEKIYGYRVNLIIHLEIHEDVVCEICKEHFHSQHALSFHLRSHATNIYECPICGKKYLQRTRFIKHRQKEHGDLMYMDPQEQWNDGDATSKKNDDDDDDDDDKVAEEVEVVPVKKTN